MFQESKNFINEFEIHHLEWPINNIEIQKLDYKYDRFSNLIKGSPNYMQYSKGVQVIAWNKNKIIKKNSI